MLGRDWKFISDIFSFNTQSIQNSLDLEKKLIRHFLKIVILKLWFLDISQHFKLIELGLKITLFFTQPHFSALYLPITPKSYFFSSYLCSYIIFRLFRTNLKALKRIFFLKAFNITAAHSDLSILRIIHPGDHLNHDDCLVLSL